MVVVLGGGNTTEASMEGLRAALLEKSQHEDTIQADISAIIATVLLVSSMA